MPVAQRVNWPDNQTVPSIPKSCELLQQLTDPNDKPVTTRQLNLNHALSAHRLLTSNG